MEVGNFGQPLCVSEEKGAELFSSWIRIHFATKELCFRYFNFRFITIHTFFFAMS